MRVAGCSPRTAHRVPHRDYTAITVLICVLVAVQRRDSTAQGTAGGSGVQFVLSAATASRSLLRTATAKFPVRAAVAARAGKAAPLTLTAHVLVAGLARAANC